MSHSTSIIAVIAQKDLDGEGSKINFQTLQSINDYGSVTDIGVIKHVSSYGVCTFSSYENESKE